VPAITSAEKFRKQRVARQRGRSQDHCNADPDAEDIAGAAALAFFMAAALERLSAMLDSKMAMTADKFAFNRCIHHFAAS